MVLQLLSEIYSPMDLLCIFIDILYRQPSVTQDNDTILLNIQTEALLKYTHGLPPLPVKDSNP